mmetsp:Transcript_84426/g.239456  ORF Transcript_84426/g.239456 Transcript_84426/m.239456 type:complete len:224 (+) Transcript_84426:152-823(+)
MEAPLQGVRQHLLSQVLQQGDHLHPVHEDTGGRLHAEEEEGLRRLLQAHHQGAAPGGEAQGRRREGPVHELRRVQRGEHLQRPQLRLLPHRERPVLPWERHAGPELPRQYALERLVHGARTFRRDGPELPPPDVERLAEGEGVRDMGAAAAGAERQGLVLQRDRGVRGARRSINRALDAAAAGPERLLRGVLRGGLLQRALLRGADGGRGLGPRGRVRLRGRN